MIKELKKLFPKAWQKDANTLVLNKCDVKDLFEIKDVIVTEYYKSFDIVTSYIYANYIVLDLYVKNNFELSISIISDHKSNNILIKIN